MPRIRPLKTKEEIDRVPVDQPVTIALDAEGVIDLPATTAEEQEAAKKAEQQQQARKKVEPEGEDEIGSLRKQMEDMRKASDTQIAQFQKQLQDAKTRAEENERNLTRSQNQAQDAEYQAILNAIGAAESEAESAQVDIARASEAQDAKMVAEASRKLARAESRLAQLEDGKAALEAQKSREAREAKEDAERRKNQPQQQNQTPEQFIDQMPSLLPSQRDWLKAHTELVVNTNKNLRLQGAHAEAVDLNLQPGTQKYFDHLETRLGYKKPDADDEDDEVDERAQIVSAPPSKQSTSPSTGRQANTTRITLTPEQREIARMSGISEIEYARGLQKLNDLKSNGGYQ